MRSTGYCVGDVSMEVPVAWQGPLPLTHISVMEGDLDDVPPSPTLDPVAPAFGSGSIFQRGFLDCAQEALRFLTEDEGMSQDNPVVVGLRQHLMHATPHITPPTSSPCLTSTLSHRARFAPYTVPSHHHLGSGCPRRELSKHSVSITLPVQNSVLHKCTTTTPSAERLERVLTNDLISADDLQGVLRCLGSGPSESPQHQNPSVSHSSSSLSSPTVYHLSTSVKGCVGHGEKSGDWRRATNSLDDSGISEISAELDDEVDGMDRQCTSVSESVSDIASPASTDSVFVSVLDSAALALTSDIDSNADGDGNNVERCSATNRFSFENLPLDISTSSPDNAHNSSGTDSAHCSNPSSQLALLSSLSTGTHCLTSPDNSDATASRIQSLASQILLLLQEEADAQDYSDNENDDDDDHVSELEVSDVEEDSWDLEAEP